MILCNVCMATTGYTICPACSLLSEREQRFVRRRTWFYNKVFLHGKLPGIQPQEKFHLNLIKNKLVVEAIVR